MSSLLSDSSLLELVLRQAVNGIIVCDAEGRLLLVNAAARRMAQKNPESETLEAIRAAWGCIYADGRLVPKEEYALSRALRGEEVMGREVRMVHGDGTFFDVVVSAAPIRDSERNIIAAVATFADVTERKRMEDALRKSEENFRRTFDESPLGAAMVSLDYRFLRVNAELCRITGYAEHELLALGFPDITHPDDLERDIAAARRLAAGEVDQYKMEKRYIRKDGSLIWVNLYARQIKDASGRPLYFLPLVEDISERKCSEVALRLTERVVAQSKGAISIVGTDYRYRRVNPVYVARTGIPEDRLTGMHVADVKGHELFMKQVKPHLDRCLAGEEIHYESWFDLPEQGRRCLEVHYSPMRSDASEIDGVVVISSDITQRKEAEQLLQHREQEFRRLAENVPDIIARYDRQLRHLYVNQQIELATGIRREAFLGKTNRDLGMPEDLVAPWEEVIRRTFASGQPQSIEFTFATPKGPGSFETRLVPEFADDGTVETVLAITRDITERKHMEEALRLSQERFRTALINTPITMFNHDAELRYTWLYNGDADFTMERSIGRTDAEILGPEVSRELTAIKAGVVASGVGVRREIELALPAGVRSYDITIEPLRDAGGHVIGITCAAVNITERKQAEKALHHARSAADRANAAKSRFLAAASHDLRQPLQAQILFHHLLTQQNRDPALTPIIDKMGQTLVAQQQMLNALLDISRLDAGIVQAETTEFAIGPVLDRLAHEFAIQADTQGIELRMVDSAAIVRSDPKLLEWILRNLLANALKYTDRGRVLLGCRRAGRCLRLQVWDTGVGIPDDQLTAIFEEFHQLGNPGRDHSLGLGLGLAIVDRLARLLGHGIKVRSVVGRGSMFEVHDVPLVCPVPARQPVEGTVDGTLDRAGMRSRWRPVPAVSARRCGTAGAAIPLASLVAQDKPHGLHGRRESAATIL